MNAPFNITYVNEPCVVNGNLASGRMCHVTAITLACGYRNGSPIAFASQLKGNLLLIHGTGDDNCHYQGAETLVNEFIRHNKQFRMMSYPNRSHGISEGANTTLHLRELMTSFLHEKLPAGAR